MSENTVKLGLMPPLTGLVEMYGAEITRAGQIACAEVNEGGGVLGKPLELVIEDDGSLPESAVAAATRLVDHHRCAAIIGNLLSNSRIAVAYQVAEPRRIPYLNFSFYEGSILSHYFFHFAALPNQQIDRMIPFMRKRYGPRMFFAGNNYEWPRGSIDAAKRALEQSGGLTVGEEYYPIGVGDGDIERLLDQVAESGAEVFVPYFAGADQAHLLTRFSARGLKKRMAVVMGHYDEVMASRLPPEVREGFYSSNTYFMTLDTPENKAYLARLAAQPEVDGIWPQGNGILTNFGEGAYLCVKAFAKAANQAGSLDAEVLVKALETVAVSGPQGAVQMDQVSHHARVNTCLSRCQADGSFTLIERFGAIPPVLPERYRHLRISKQTGHEDIYLESRMMAQISEAVLLVHATDGTIVYTNPGAERMFGYKPNELSGKRFSMLFAPSMKSPAEATAAIGKVLSRKGVWRGETENITRDGKRFWCAASASVFTHPEFGEVWMILNKDITERKQAEGQLRASEALLRRTQSLAAVGSWRLNMPQNELVWSAETYRIFDIPAATPISYESFLVKVHPDDRKLVNSAWQAALKGAPYRIQHRIVVHGETRWVEERAELDFDARGNLLSGAGSVQDITERKQAEEKSRATSLYARSLIEASLDPLVTISAEGKITDVNEATERATGVPRQQMIGSDFSEYFTEPEQARSGYQEVFAKGLVIDYPLSIRHVSGKVADVLYNATVYRDEAGNILGGFAAARDITERKLAENKLWEKEERLALATIQNGVGVWDWNLVTQEMIWDDSMFALYHIRREDFIGTEEAWRAALHPDDLERGDREVNDAISGLKPFDTEFRVVWPGGEIRHIKAVAKVFRDERGTPLRMLGINMDITELRRTATALQEKSNLLRNIIDSSADYIYAKDRELRTILCNEIFAKTVGKHVQDIIGKTDIENGWNPELVRGNAAKGIRGYEQDDLDAIAGKTIRSVDQLYVDGEPHYVDTVKLPLRDDAGRTLGMFGISRDITASKLRENIQLARLRLTDYAANHTLKELLIATLDEACALTGSSIGFYHFLDEDQQTLTLQAWSTRTTEEFCKAEGDGNHYGIDQAGVWVDCVRERRAVIHNDYAALPHKRGMPPGHAHVEREMVVPIFRNKLIVAILGVGNKAVPYKDSDLDSATKLADLAWDIAVAKRAEEEVRRLNVKLEQRVAARTAQLEAANQELESFAYSVSHDLRVPLRAIDGFSRLVLKQYEGKLDDEGKRLLNVVRDNTQRMGQLIDDILAFSRAGRLEIKASTTDMAALAREAWQELEPSRAEREVLIEIKPLPNAQGDRAMLRQVWANLLANAAKFTLPKPAARIEIEGNIEGTECIYCIRDNGVGFDQQYVHKLFGVFQRLHGIDEFEGTGIGLAIVKRIVTRHGGRVWAEGKVNEGAAFYFALPCLEEKQS